MTNTTSLYAILNAGAKALWYHRTLREQGNEAEARRRERQSIRRNVQDLRDALEHGGALFIGRYVATLYTTPSAWTYLHPHTIAAARHVGIPIIDSRTVPETALVRYEAYAPLFRPGQPDSDGSDGSDPYRYVGLDEYIRYARPYGVTVENYGDCWIDGYEEE